jgi:hypothetical protein
MLASSHTKIHHNHNFAWMIIAWYRSTWYRFKVRRIRSGCSPAYLASAIVMEEQLSIQVSRLCSKEALQVMVTPFEGNIVHRYLHQKKVQQQEQQQQIQIQLLNTYGVLCVECPPISHIALFLPCTIFLTCTTPASAAPGRRTTAFEGNAVSTCNCSYSY